MMPVEARWAVAVLLLAAAAAFPFLPGRHDPLAMPLAMIALIVARGGLLLVPIGALLLALGSQKARARLVVAAMIVTALVWCAAGLSPRNWRRREPSR